MSQLRLFRSFATEILKIAREELLDADIRDLNAERRQDDEYIPAGRLATNTQLEIPKLAVDGSSFSPGEELKRTQQVGTFLKKVHTPTLRSPIGVGKAFRQ